MKVEIYRSHNGRWYWHLIAANGRTIADGAEGYASARNAERAARRVRNLFSMPCVNFEVVRS